MSIADEIGAESNENEVCDGAVAELLAEFNEALRTQGHADFDEYLTRCPEEHRQELLSLMNVLALTFNAFAPLREKKSD